MVSSAGAAPSCIITRRPAGVTATLPGCERQKGSDPRDRDTAGYR
jgi:hypothetical protein